MYACIRKQDYTGARMHLNRILDLRNTMVQNQLFPSFTYAMNLLGCPGNFSPDYAGELDSLQRTVIENKMREIGEL